MSVLVRIDVCFGILLAQGLISLDLCACHELSSISAISHNEGPHVVSVPVRMESSLESLCLSEWC